MKKMQTMGVALMLVAGTLGTAWADTAPLKPTTIQVVGSPSNLSHYLKFEKPFWDQEVPQQSNGAVKVTLKGFNEMGLKGPEMLRLIAQGVIPVGVSTLAYFASDAPINEAVDLAGLAPSAEMAQRVTQAFEPVLAERFGKENIKLLGLSPNPAQVLFCNKPVASLADLKGKKVRTSSRTQGELVQALGGVSVTLSFGEVVPALQNGVVDCAISGSMPGFLAKWYEVSTHLYTLPINWGQQIHAANADYWNKLDPAVRTFLEQGIQAMIARAWQAAGPDTEMGFYCNAGMSQCEYDVKGRMTLVHPTEEDRATLRQLMQDVIIPKWAARCAGDCVPRFNETVGKVLDIPPVNP